MYIKFYKFFSISKGYYKKNLIGVSGSSHDGLASTNSEWDCLKMCGGVFKGEWHLQRNYDNKKDEWHNGLIAMLYGKKAEGGLAG